jgi:hypothetical protein
MTNEEVVNYFTGKGYKPHQAAAIAGNLGQESTLNPEAINSKSGAFGLAQWLGPRKRALQDYARRQGSYAADPGTQLDFIDHELNTTERRARTKLLASNTLEDATTAFSDHFERAGKNEKNNARRISLAEKAMNFVIPTASADETPYKKPSVDYGSMSEEELVKLASDYTKMSDNELLALAGRKENTAAPDYGKMSDDELLAIVHKEQNQAQNQERYGKSQDITWGEVPEQALKHLPESAGKALSGLAEAVTSPVSTVQNLWGLATGGAASLPGIGQFAGATPEDRELYQNVAKGYKEKYWGSPGAFKNAIATDPVGVALDVSTLLSGAGGLAKMANLPKAAGALSTASSFIDPLALAAKGVSKVGGKVPEILGMTSGTGAMPIRQAFKAGKQGGGAAEALQNTMRGNTDISTLVTIGKQGIRNLRAEKSAAYTAAMEPILKDRTVLSLGGVKRAADEAFDIGRFEGVSINPEAAAVQGKVNASLEKWGNLDPNTYHTAGGLDALKKEIGVIKDAEVPNTPARIVADQVYNAVRKEIEKQHTGYGKVMQDYARESEKVKNLQSTFSLGPKAMEDTAIRKLTSVGRNNVNTNYGKRLDLANELERAAGTSGDTSYLMSQIAGHALNNWTPRGIQGAVGGGGVVAALSNPALLAAAPLLSPRTIGELALASGKVARYSKNIPKPTAAQIRAYALTARAVKEPKKEKKKD